jgi:ribonuclease P protein component
VLPAAQRLRRRQDFVETVRRGRRLPDSGLVAHWVLDPGVQTNGARVGFVVSRAVGPAVVRNRLRRRLRHLCAAHIEELPPGTRVVIRTSPRAAAASSAVLAPVVERMFRAIGSAGR